RVEELVRIWEARPVGKGKLHLPFVGVGDRDYSAARPHRASHPLPFLDDLPVGLADALADAGERFATPVRELCDQPVDTFRWIHWIFMPRNPFPRTLESGHEPSSEILAAVRRQRRAGDEAGIIGGEEDDAARDLLRLAQPAERDVRQDALLQHVL